MFLLTEWVIAYYVPLVIMWKIIVLLVIIFLIARFVMRYVMPIVLVTKTAHDKLSEMQKRMEQMQQEQERATKKQNRSVDGDYIDYEEVK